MLIRKYSRYEADVGNELTRMCRKTAVQMKDCKFSGKHTASIISIVQDFKAVCDARNIHEGVGTWLSKHLLTSTIDGILKAREALPTETVM